MTKKKIMILAVAAALLILLCFAGFMTFSSHSVPTGQGISYEEAASIALKQAGLNTQNTTFLRSRAEMDDGRWEYEVDFLSGLTRYTYQIDASTGMVLDAETEPLFDIFD